MEETKSKFYQKAWFAWVMLIVFAPVGIFLMFKYGHHNKAVRVVGSVVFGLIFLAAAFGGSDEAVETVATPDEVSAEEESTEESTEEEAKEEEEEVEAQVEEIVFTFDQAEYVAETKTFDIKVTTDLPDGTEVYFALRTPDNEYDYNGTIESTEVKDGQLQVQITQLDDEFDGPYPIENGTFDLVGSFSVSDERNTVVVDAFGGYDDFVSNYSINGDIKETDTGFVVERIAKQSVEITGAATAEEGQKMRAEFKKDTADTIEYAHLEKNPDRYVGEYVKYTGEIAQIQEGNNTTVIRLALDDYYSDIIYVEYEGYTDFVAEDTVTIYGTVWGSHSYTSQAGWEITLPAVIAEIVE